MRYYTSLEAAVLAATLRVERRNRFVKMCACLILGAALGILYAGHC